MSIENDEERLINEELTELRQRVTELEAIEIDREKKKQLDIESRHARHKYLSVILAGLPVIFGTVLFIVNRSYFLQFFTQENRTCGLPMLGVVILLAALAYPAMRGSLSVIESGRQSLGVLRAVLVVIFLILPALFLLFLGPAALILLSSPLGSIK